MAITSQIGIIDRTTAEALSAGALAMWQAMIQGAERMGLARIVMTAGAGGGHQSHAHGTEIDLVGYNADGSLWTPAQRVGVAAAAAAVGGNRFGFYSRSGAAASHLHVGLGYNGAPRNVAWGPGGATGGVSVNAFNPAERDFVQALRGGTMASYLPTVVGSAAVAGNISVETNRYEGNPFGVAPSPAAPSPAVDVRLTSPDNFKVEVSSDEAKRTDAAANRRAMIDAMAPSVRQVIERGGLIRVGVNGDAVRQLQAFLNRAGFTDADGNPLEEDGEFGRRTRAALMAYQEARGVTADGILGPQTFGRMAADITGMDTGAATVAPPVYTPSPPMQQAAAAAAGEGIGRRSEGDAVRELQQWLNFHGFVDASGNSLAVDGDFGPRTEQALVAAQRAAGVPPTGRLDEVTTAAFRVLDQHEANVTMPDVNATAPVDDTLPPVAVQPVPDRSYEAIYDQPDLTDAQYAQYAAEKGMRTEPAVTTAPAAPAAPQPYIPPGWRPIPPEMAELEAAYQPQREEWRREQMPATVPVTGTTGDDADTAMLDEAPVLTDAQRAQYAGERTMATEAAPLVRSSPATPQGQAVLTWAIPVPPAPVGPLASPYPVRFTVPPTPLTRQQIAERDGAAIVAGARRMAAGVDPASVVASMPQVSFPAQGGAPAPVAATPPADPPAASGAPRPVPTTLVEADPYRQVAVDNGFMPGMRDDFNRDGYDNLPGVANPPGQIMAPEGGTNYRPPTAVETSTLAPFTPPNTARLKPNVNSAGPDALNAQTFATMTQQELMGVNPSTLTREQWTEYDAALTRALNDLKSTGPNWLRDKLRQNGAPAERLATASTSDLIAMSAQADKRIVPAGIATTPPKPPKNDALDKTKLLVRTPIPSAQALA